MPVIACPNCGTQLNAPDNLLGQQVTCGKCRCLFVAQPQIPPSAQPLAARAPAGAMPNGAEPAAAPLPPQAPPMVALPGPVGQTGYQQVTAGYYQPAPLATSGYAVASLVLGIASLVTCLCYAVPPLILGPLALVFSSIAMKDIRAGAAGPSSSGLAKAGKICGLIGLLLAIGAWILGVVFFVVARQSRW